MIIGLGSDLIDIRRVEKTLERHGDRFVQRIFTTIEQKVLHPKTETVGGVMKDESAELLRRFFQEKR